MRQYQESLRQTESPLGNLWGPAAVLAAGLILIFASPIAGALLMLAGFVWLTTKSLPGALAVFILASPFPFGLTFHRHHIDLSDLMAIVMAVRLLLDARKQSVGAVWQKFMGSPFLRPLLLLLVLSVLSLATALSHSTTVIKILEYVEFFVVLVAVARQADVKESSWKPVLGALFIIASAMAFYGIYQFLFQLGPAANVVDVHHVRAEAVFGQPNAFGGFEAMVFPFVVALIAYGPDWARRWWMWAVAAIVALGVIASFSRGAWVSDMGAIGFMGVLVWVISGRASIHRRFVIPAIVFPVLAFLAIDLLGKTNLSHTVGILSHQTTGERLRSTVTAIINPKGHFDTNQRLLIWKAALSAIRQHPILGVGLGGFHRYVVLHPVKGLPAAPPMAHNLYLEWGADLGVLGIVASLWLEWSWLKQSIGTLAQKARVLDRFWYAMGVGAFGAIVSFIVHDWVDFMIDHGVIVPLLLALAVVWVIKETRVTDRGQ